MNIENKKQIAIILLAVGLGLVAAVLTANHIQDSIKTETARLSQEFENKKMRPLVEEIKDMQAELQKVKDRPIPQMPQVQAALSLPKSSLALRTPEGKRAYTVRIDALSAVGGMINPGDYVDIIAHMDMPDPVTNENEKISSMIFQNIQVLAVGVKFQAPGEYEEQQEARALNITFALSPEEASLLSFIEKNGRMQLVLRPPEETATEVIQAASWSSLADYVFEKQGTELVVPRSKADIEPVKSDKQEEVKPFIQIFRGGQAF